MYKQLRKKAVQPLSIGRLHRLDSRFCFFKNASLLLFIV